MRRHIALVGAVWLGTQALGAQSPGAPGAPVATNRFEVGAHAGVQVFSRGTALQNTPFAGLDASRALRWNPFARLIAGSSLDVRLQLDVARPATRGNQFGAVAIDRGDTTLLYTVRQRVTLLQGGVEVAASAPMGPLRGYGFAGAGVYSLVPDARAKRTNGAFAHPMATFGGGLRYAINARLRLHAQLRAVTFTKFDRNRLDAGTAYTHDPRFSDALPAADATSRTPTNVQVSIAFQYSRGGS